MSLPPEKPDSFDPSAVPVAVVNRLSLYLRELQHLVGEGVETTNSSELGRRLGFTDAQVRKDLAYFGQFGHPGIGYRPDELVTAIRGILGTDRTWPVCIVGVGNLGSALLGYKGFAHQNFRLVAAFDVDHKKIGAVIQNVPVFSLDDMPQVVRDQGILLGMIAVPASAAQTAADKLVEAGVSGIVNFAPVTIQLPAEISLVGVDLAIELEQITFSVVNHAK